MIKEIQNQLYCLEVPLPNNPLKATNSYILLSDKRNLIIDSGFNRSECLEAMQAGLNEIKLDLSRTDFLSTHLHADHQGLFGELRQDGAIMYMGDEDAKRMETTTGWEEMMKYGALNGFPAAELRSAVFNHPGRKHSPQQTIKWTHLKEGDTVAVGDYSLKCIETPGHTWGHICLYDEGKKLLFAGDHILGDITPNIQVWAADDDPLKSYIESLNKVAKLDIELTLPGHRSFIDDTNGRIEALKIHHLNRCNEVLDILRAGKQHAYQTASKMSWDIRAKSWDDFPLMQKWFATGEAMAHLRYLEKRDLINTESAEDNTVLFSLVDPEVKLETVD